MVDAAGRALSGMNTTGLISLAAALGWASGLRLYLAAFLTGLAGAMGWIVLPAGLHVSQHPLVLGASGFMLFVEFFADKILGVDSLWNITHSVISVPAGAALAAGVFGADNATMALVAGLLGGSLAAASAATRVTTRYGRIRGEHVSHLMAVTRAQVQRVETTSTNRGMIYVAGNLNVR